MRPSKTPRRDLRASKLSPFTTPVCLTLAPIAALVLMALAPVAARADVSLPAVCNGAHTQGVLTFFAGIPSSYGLNAAQQDCNYNVVVGGNSVAGANNSFGNIAINSAIATGGSSTAVGHGSQATGASSSAFGTLAGATGINSTALGQNAGATGNFSSALGSSSGASGEYATALGTASMAYGLNAVAVGNASAATAQNASAVGFNSRSIGSNATAIGVFSFARATGSVAIGHVADAAQQYSVAIGDNSKASGINSVAIGSDSWDGGLSNVVSVGTAAQTRAIINVTAGSVTATSTDAVNGSQLHATNQAVATAQSTANTAVANFTSGAVNASFASANLNNGGITNAGSISGVAAATSADQAVNFGQLQAVMTQLMQSGICSMDGNSVKCTAAQAATNAVQIGNNSRAGFAGSIAIGNGAQITAPTQAGSSSGAIAIGNGARANADPSVALGNAADATGANAVAIGDSTVATGSSSSALGYQATASGNSSVALGAGSNDGGLSNVVSVGGSGSERRIINVAPGTSATDAVNLGQMNNAINAMGASSVAIAKAYTDHQVTAVQKYAARGVAASMASNAQITLAPGETGVAVGTGYYDGQSAIGLALRHMTSSGTQFNVAGGMSNGGKLALQAGVGWKW